MRPGFRHGLAIAGVAVLLAGGCSSNDSTSTSAGSTAPPSSAAAVTTTVAPARTTTPTTAPPTAVAGPAAAEAGGWRVVISAPTAGATVGPAFDLCYEVTGPVREATVAFDLSLVIAATGTTAATVRVDAAVGRGSARVNLGTTTPRIYDMPVQGIVNGQPVAGLALIVHGVNVGVAPPAGCG